MSPEEYVKASMEGSFLMPLDIINQIEKMSHSPNNDSKISDLLDEYGVDVCLSSVHRDFFKTLQIQHLKSDDKGKYHENCLGCGGII